MKKKRVGSLDYNEVSFNLLSRPADTTRGRKGWEGKKRIEFILVCFFFQGRLRVRVFHVVVELLITLIVLIPLYAAL